MRQSAERWPGRAWAWIVGIWNEIHVILPMGLTWGGLVFGVPVLAEEKKWSHTATLIPGLLRDGKVEHISTDAPSLLWRAYDAVRGWAPYLSVLLGLGAGIVQAVWPLFPSLPFVATLGLSVLATILVSVAAVGWLTTITVFFRGPPLGKL